MEKYELDEKKESKTAVATYVTGLISFILGIIALVPFSFFVWIPGLILGYISKNKYEEQKQYRNAEKGLNFAKKGILFSYIGIAIGVISLILYVAIIIGMMQSYYY